MQEKVYLWATMAVYAKFKSMPEILTWDYMLFSFEYNISNSVHFRQV
jgi:hypothetical protein